MKVDFENIFGHAVPLNGFRLNWRFTDANCDKLLIQHLNLLHPLDKDASQFLWDYIVKANLHQDIPFKKDFFQTIDEAKILIDNEEAIKQWLYQRGIPSDELVFLSWSPEEAMMVPWKILIKYFGSFYYRSSDDLTVIDQSLTWALLFFHTDEIYFGTKKEFEPCETYNETSFI